MGFVNIPEDKKAFWSRKFRNYSNVVYWSLFFIAVLFGFVYVLFLLIINGRAALEYKSPTAYIGFIIHGISGSIYYVSGYLQFCSSIRQNYPKFHRICGWTYCALSVLLWLSIILIFIGGSIAKDSAIIAV